jgi:hypothetical protein
MTPENITKYENAFLFIIGNVKERKAHFEFCVFISKNIPVYAIMFRR